jgi:catechol 2,3-dioxygenase-like lactoylglutathione lyase family enzyme
MLTALDHVILAVRDLDAARVDYQELLGLSPSWGGLHPEAGTANVLFRLENTYLELLSPSGAGPVGELVNGLLDARGEGMLGLAFATDDIEACRATLLERGLQPGPVEADHGRNPTTGAERRWRRVALPPDRTRNLLVFPIRHDSPASTLPMAPPTGDPALSVHALDHAVVQSTDGNATRALFGEALGLRLAVDKEFADWGVRLMFFRVGGVTVEVASALAGVDALAAMPAAAAGSASDRFYGMSLRVRSVDGARERLAQLGFDVSQVRQGRRPGTRVFTVRSRTHGVPTLILELDGDSPPATSQR